MDVQPDVVSLKLRLAELSDALTARVIVEEANLRALDLGVETFIPIDDRHRFGYTKLGGEWHLAVRLLGETKDDPDVTQKLADTTRGQRLACLKRVPLLRAAIIENAVHLADRIDKYLRQPDE